MLLEQLKIKIFNEIINLNKIWLIIFDKLWWISNFQSSFKNLIDYHTLYDNVLDFFSSNIYFEALLFVDFFYIAWSGAGANSFFLSSNNGSIYEALNPISSISSKVFFLKTSETNILFGMYQNTIK